MERVSRCWTAAYTAFSRTKTVDIQNIHDTELKRCLDVVDLTALGHYTSLFLRCSNLLPEPTVVMAWTGHSVVFVKSMSRDKTAEHISIKLGNYR